MKDHLSLLSYAKSAFTQIPPEIFAEICAHLSPKNLLSLGQVCRLFRAYLVSESSSSTQFIWRECRVRFLPAYDLPPPDRMGERDYIRLIVENYCQVCLQKTVGTFHIRWEFGIRVCNKCFEANIAIDSPRFARKYGVPKQLLLALPFGNHHRKYVYWMPQVRQLCVDYSSLQNDDKPVWLQERVKSAYQAVQQKKIRKACRQHQNQELKRLRREEIVRRVEEMLKETSENGELKYDSVFIQNQCRVYQDAILQEYKRPFTNSAWSRLKRKIVQEHEYILKRSKENHDKCPQLREML
ncbi:hypothetical protein G9A89_004583 [Geosiphon pyriformis]|nr:hypothetical protein G9A89_004583 [Geosiphon pyriformis]